VADNIVVKKGIDAGLDDNAIAAVSKCASPGTKDGQPVAVQARSK